MVVFLEDFSEENHLYFCRSERPMRLLGSSLKISANSCPNVSRSDLVSEGFVRSFKDLRLKPF
jgi:hypothetical protein